MLPPIAIVRASCFSGVVSFFSISSSPDSAKFLTYHHTCPRSPLLAHTRTLYANTGDNGAAKKRDINRRPCGPKHGEAGRAGLLEPSYLRGRYSPDCRRLQRRGVRTQTLTPAYELYIVLI